MKFPVQGCSLLPVVFLIHTALHAQQTTRELRLPEVGWTLHIPPGTKLESGQIDSLIEVTKKKIQPTNLDIKGMHVLFAFLDPPYNSFASAISKYDTTSSVSWTVYHDSAKMQLMKLFASMHPRLKILDTASTVEQLGGRLFQRFYLKTFYPENQVTLQTYWYACVYRGYDFAINVSFSDEATGQALLGILRHSIFDQDR